MPERERSTSDLLTFIIPKTNYTALIVAMLSALIVLAMLLLPSVVLGGSSHHEGVSIQPPTTESLQQRPPPSVEQDHCVPFEHHYCSRFGYNYTISPNPWARDLTLEQAGLEFDDFSRLFDSNCSNKLGTFLCFTYFPLCYEHSTGGEQRQLVLPCKETCEAVHSSKCNDLILDSVGAWGNHLQCSNFHTKQETENGNCADGQQEEWTSRTTEDKKNGGKEEITPPTHITEETVDNCSGMYNFELEIGDTHVTNFYVCYSYRFYNLNLCSVL